MKPNNPNSVEDLSIEFHSHSGGRKKNGLRRCNTNLWVYWRVFVQPSLRTVAIRRSLLPTDHGVGFAIALVVHSVDPTKLEGLGDSEKRQSADFRHPDEFLVLVVQEVLYRERYACVG